MTTHGGSRGGRDPKAVHEVEIKDDPDGPDGIAEGLWQPTGSAN
jgi:hypothetical protein